MILKSSSLLSNAEMQISETSNDDGDSFYIQVTNHINPGRITVNKDELRAAILPELTEGVGQPTLTSKKPWVTPSGNYVLYDEDDSRITLNVSRNDSNPGLLQLILSNGANNTSMRTFLREEDLLTALGHSDLGAASLASQLDKVLHQIEVWETSERDRDNEYASTLRGVLNTFELPTKHAAVISGQRRFDGKRVRYTNINGKWFSDNGILIQPEDLLGDFDHLRLVRDGIEDEA